MENEHCVLVALPYGTNNIEQLTQSNYLKNGFITYLQEKKAAGIINITTPDAAQVIILKENFNFKIVLKIFPQIFSYHMSYIYFHHVHSQMIL